MLLPHGWTQAPETQLFNSLYTPTHIIIRLYPPIQSHFYRFRRIISANTHLVVLNTSPFHEFINTIAEFIQSRIPNTSSFIHTSSHSSSPSPSSPPPPPPSSSSFSSSSPWMALQSNANRHLHNALLPVSPVLDLPFQFVI